MEIVKIPPQKYSVICLEIGCGVSIREQPLAYIEYLITKGKYAGHIKRSYFAYLANFRIMPFFLEQLHLLGLPWETFDVSGFPDNVKEFVKKMDGLEKGVPHTIQVRYPQGSDFPIIEVYAMKHKLHEEL